MEYPEYCKECIHKLVCKYVDQVQKWEDMHSPMPIRLEKVMIPINVNCGAKITITNLKSIK